MERALTIAQYVVNFCFEQGTPISNLQLQKILYFIQRECLKSNGNPAFFDNIIAWRLGPVVMNVYNEFSPYVGRPILRQFPDATLNSAGLKAIVDRVVNENRRRTAWELVNLTHRTGEAWDRIYQGGIGKNNIIPVEAIREDIVREQ